MNTIIHNVQGHIQRVGVLLTRRNDVTTTTRRSQRTGEKSRRAEDTRGRDGVKTGFALLTFFPSHLLPFLVVFVALWCVSLCLPLTAGAAGSSCAEVKIEISQELTLERQAFEAHMRINNRVSHITLEDVAVTVNFTDEEGTPVEASSDPESTTAKFFIRLNSTENLDNLHIEPNNLDFTGAVAPSSTADMYWLIIPAPGSGTPPDPPQGGNPSSQEGNSQKKLYYVGATLTYTIGGEEHVTEVNPDYIFVKPLPDLVLDYFWPTEVYADDAFTTEIEPSIPFSVGVRVSNQGYGTAQQLKIDSAQPKIVANDQGLVINFVIEGSEVNGQAATPNLLANFGNIEPNSAGVARWIMTCPLSGTFEYFKTEFSHSDALGGELTSIIESSNTHFLLRDVLVDLPGRDTIRDFLATVSTADTDLNVYKVYESELITATDVSDLSEASTLTPVDGSDTAYTLSTPVTAGFLSVSKPVPDTLTVPDTWPWPVSAVRSDGKQIKPENVWISKIRKENPAEGWNYVVNLFDVNATVTLHSYTLVFGGGAAEPLPPAIQPIPDQSLLEGEWLSLVVEASDPDGTIPALSAASLPAGAAFTDHGDGTGTLIWTPGIGQAGTYLITLMASDGTLTDSQHVVITVMPDSGYIITASAGIGGTISPTGTIIVNAGEDQTFTIAPDEGYVIEDVLVDGSSEGAKDTHTFTNVTANHTIKAVFAPNTYTITATAGANGSIIPSGTVTMYHGETRTFTITPDGGYHIIDVLVDGASVDFDGFKDEHNFVIGGTVTFTSVDADHTLEAVFDIRTYPILATAGDGGSMSPSGELTVDHGAEQRFTITPDAGYHIADVLVDGISVGAVNAYTLSHVTAPHSIQALFASGTHTHTITATAGANGSILPTGTVTVEDGMDQSFTITTESGYHIADVLVDGVSVGAVSTYTFSNVTDDHTIEVTFAADITTFTITATAGANGSMTPSGDVMVEVGAEQSFTISADVGYSIDDVLVDGSSVGAVEVYAFTNVTDDHTIEAVFSTTAPTPTPTETPIPEAVTISGRVWTSDGFTGLPDVALNGLPGSPTTDDQGYYQSNVESGWSGTVTPQKLDYSFTPVFRSYSSLMVDQEQQDYTGTAPSQTLTVVLAGDGSGVVTGDGGINCGTVCSIPVEKYTQVYLSAIPDSGSLFAGAEGAECTPEGTCVLTMTEDTTVTVTFTRELEPTPTPTVGPEPTPTPTTPVIPEPATGFLVMLGLLALLGLGVRRRKKQK